jgi:hypothetical protein
VSNLQVGAEEATTAKSEALVLKAKSSAWSGLKMPLPPLMGHGTHSHEGHATCSHKGHDACSHKGMLCTATRGTMWHVHVALKCLSLPCIIAISYGAWWALKGHGMCSHERHGVCSCEGHGVHSHEGHDAAHAYSVEMSVLAMCCHRRGCWLWAQLQGGEGHNMVHVGGIDMSCPHHALLPSLPSVVGHGGPLREGWLLAWRK